MESAVDQGCRAEPMVHCICCGVRPVATLPMRWWVHLAKLDRPLSSPRAGSFSVLPSLAKIFSLFTSLALPPPPPSTTQIFCRRQTRFVPQSAQHQHPRLPTPPPTMSTLSTAARGPGARLLAATRTARRTMASGKEIRFGVEGRAAMLRGVDLLADAVQVSSRLARVAIAIVNRVRWRGRSCSWLSVLQRGSEP